MVKIKKLKHLLELHGLKQANESEIDKRFNAVQRISEWYVRAGSEAMCEKWLVAVVKRIFSANYLKEFFSVQKMSPEKWPKVIIIVTMNQMWTAVTTTPDTTLSSSNDGAEILYTFLMYYLLFVMIKFCGNQY